MEQSDEEIYVPREEDRDPEAEALMEAQADSEGGNQLFDPWFSSAEEAQEWDGVSEFAEGGEPDGPQA